MLEYKCEWYGKKLIAVDPKNTSRICSKCGYNSGAKPLEIREWTCSKWSGTDHGNKLSSVS
ncbi:zinc ribbon domain-containing protein, partial [Lactobacillus helveticus]